jgi:large subunit ribosomal protein L1
LMDLNKTKPSTAKGVYVQGITLSSTMGPGIAVDSASIDGING